MSIRFFIFSFAAALMVGAATAHARSQEQSAESLLPGKTWWSGGHLDRYYFGRDGSFLQQFFSDKDGYKAGDVLKGQWSINEAGHVCWTYSEPVIDGEFCHAFKHHADAPKAWGKYDDMVDLKTVMDDGTVRTAFEWDRWMDGNLILKQEAAARMPDHLEGMKALAEAFNDPAMLQTLSPRASEADLSNTMKSYVETYTGAIMQLPMGYLYHKADGTSYLSDVRVLRKLIEDPEFFDMNELIEKQAIVENEWAVNDYAHCWRSTQNSGPMCQIVFSGNDLYDPRPGFVHVMSDGFIRHIPLPSPE